MTTKAPQRTVMDKATPEDYPMMRGCPLIGSAGARDRFVWIDYPARHPAKSPLDIPRIAIRKSAFVTDSVDFVTIDRVTIFTRCLHNLELPVEIRRGIAADDALFKGRCARDRLLKFLHVICTEMCGG